MTLTITKIKTVMFTYECSLTTKAFCVLFIFSLLGATPVSAQKKSAAQIAAEREIDGKRSEVNALRSDILLKKAEIDRKQGIFDERKAAYIAEEERIEARDNAVKNRESCMSNLLADVLPYFATEVIAEYSTQKGGNSSTKKIEQFAFGQKMIEVLEPAYRLAHKDYLSTFVDNTDRVAFAAYADETFDQYFLGGVDRSGDTLEGILSEHFHPKNLPAIQDVAQPLADRYIGNLEALNYAGTKTMNMAKAMPLQFYVGWDRFVNDCGMVVVSVMKDKRRKERVPEVEAQAKLGTELRMEFLHLQELKAQRQAMEEELYIAESNLKFLEESYQKRYKRAY